jgi:hypothetical protein
MYVYARVSSFFEAKNAVFTDFNPQVVGSIPTELIR